MQTKLIIIILFLIVAAVQIYIPASMILDQEEIITAGKTYKFETQPVDPNDPMRGKYINLGYKENLFIIPDSVYFYRNQKVFVLLEEGSDGFAKIKNVVTEQPANDLNYVKATINEPGYYRDSTNLWIQYPFNRFYMEEYKAPEAEKVYDGSTWDKDVTTWAVVKVKAGDAVLQDVMINGKSIVDFVNAQQLEK